METADMVALGGIAVCSLLLLLISLYFKFGLFKGFCHDVLGWHTPDYKMGAWDDGCSLHAKCKHCGEDIMMDSQGNWFTYDGGAEDG